MLESKTVLQMLFNAGLNVFDLNATVIGDFPLSGGRIGLNFMDNETIAAALREGKSAVSRPTLGKVLKSPVFGMTVPIRNEQGQVIGALSGVTNLGTGHRRSLRENRRLYSHRSAASADCHGDR